MIDQATLSCQDEPRRKVARDNGWNGIDDVEVGDDGRSLCVRFFGRVPDDIAIANLLIKGGRRVRNIKVVAIEIHHATDLELDDCLSVTVDRTGDFSTYTLRLAELDERGHPTTQPFHGFDPRYAQVQFSFKVNCLGDLDCLPDDTCPPVVTRTPEINYLAKDYASFRQLMLDRLALIMPDWRERLVPDLGITLVELLAYVGDHLSYYQDSVATEAYLDTARQRISIRRHARLVDYQMHEGCNARAWVCITTNQDLPAIAPADIAFLTSCEELAQLGSTLLVEDQLRSIPADRFEAFEPLVADPAAPILIRAAHSEIPFYTWGDAECCLPRGATRATLLDTWLDPTRTPETPTAQARQAREAPKAAAAEADQPGRALNLQVGDVLIFEEVIGPRTGNPADADPARRHAVRLTEVTPAVDELDPEHPKPVIEIAWSEADALPFALCLSARLPATDTRRPCQDLTGVSVARGNVLLVDHGRTIAAPEPLGVVDASAQTAECGCDGVPIDVAILPAPFRPVLARAPLSFSQPLGQSSAAAMIGQDPHLALPQLKLTGVPSTPTLPIDLADARWQWYPRYDLLGSQSHEQHVVVEIDNDARTHLRFGDGSLGRMPAAGTLFSTVYRVGNGPAGNVGAETIRYMLTKQLISGPKIGVRNPMSATGGTAPESLAEVKLFAPYIFRAQAQRAITADDYARLAERSGAIQRAAAALRWTGSWYAARVALDPRGGEVASAELLNATSGALYRYRRMGHDLAVEPARYVPLEIELSICVLPHYLRGHVEAELRDRFSSRVLPNGRLGLFHPDNLTFGTGIALSALVATAQAVAGVQSAEVTKLERQFAGPNGEIANGILPLGALEIAQLDSDPNFPEHGRLTLLMRGGR